MNRQHHDVGHIEFLQASVSSSGKIEPVNNLCPEVWEELNESMTISTACSIPKCKLLLFILSSIKVVAAEPALLSHLVGAGRVRELVLVTKDPLLRDGKGER